MGQSPSVGPDRSTWRAAVRLCVRVALVTGLVVFYVTAASEHARRVNTSKARGDQTPCLRYAINLYENWHGKNPPILGDRNRMPLYPAFQALFYDPRLSDPEFFVEAKKRNIRLSLLLLALLGAIFHWHLPRHVATNLILIVAFGYFVFKAGYVQPELLFYFLFFVAFLASCHLIACRGTTARVVFAVLAGTFAALAHLTKAAMPPFVVVVLTVCGVREITCLLRDWRRATEARAVLLRRFAVGAIACSLLGACFLGVMYPYISNSKRVFGQYFYNVNSTFYIWYDGWAQAIGGTRAYKDRVGWPSMPAEQLPSMRKYLRTHSVRQIAARIRGGLVDMLKQSYNRYWYFKYAVLYVVFAGLLLASNRTAAVDMVREHGALFCFLVIYGAVYLLLTAFYHPVSGTGTARYLLAHVTPLMFVLSLLSARAPFRDTVWSVGRIDLTPTHFQWLVSITLGLDLTFSLWPRLMTTYAGF
jgi:hypothetical protein